MPPNFMMLTMEACRKEIWMSIILATDRSEIHLLRQVWSRLKHCLIDFSSMPKSRLTTEGEYMSEQTSYK